MAGPGPSSGETVPECSCLVCRGPASRAAPSSPSARGRVRAPRRPCHREMGAVTKALEGRTRPGMKGPGGVALPDRSCHRLGGSLNREFRVVCLCASIRAAARVHPADDVEHAQNRQTA